MSLDGQQLGRDRSRHTLYLRDFVLQASEAERAISPPGCEESSLTSVGAVPTARALDAGPQRLRGTLRVACRGRVFVLRRAARPPSEVVHLRAWATPGEAISPA